MLPRRGLEGAEVRAQTPIEEIVVAVIVVQPLHCIGNTATTREVRAQRVIVGTTLAREQKQILFTPSSLNPDIPHFLRQKKHLCFYKCKYKHKYTTEVSE